MSGISASALNVNDHEMKILIVDDEPSIVQLLQLALQAMGFKNVATANDAKNALGLVDQADEPFECFLVDIQMPDMDGMELCQALRQNPSYKRTPILMLTAMSDRGYIEQAFSAGANDYITKPFEIEDLVSRVNKAARLHREIVSSDKIVRNIASMCEGDAETPDLKLEDPFSFDGVSGYLDQPTFKNYIDRMERSQFRLGAVVAVNIVDVQGLFDRSTAQEFLKLIFQMGDVISTALRNERFHFTYAGAGRFMVFAVDADKTGFDKEVDSLAKEELSRVDLHCPASDPAKVEISTGRIFRKASGEFGSIDDSLIRAQKRVQFGT